MSIDADERALFQNVGIDGTGLDDANLDFRHQRQSYTPSKQGKIGRFSLVAFILNRIIGSGIFFAPGRVLAGTESVGGAFMLRAAAAMITICGCYVWNECAFGMPQNTVGGEKKPRGVPRNAGEKNYVEFVFANNGSRPPHIRTTCCFAGMFMLLYNLSANAMAFSLEALAASGSFDPTTAEMPPRGQVIAVAIAALTVAIMAHTVSRECSIYINNAFAFIKVALLLTMFFLAIAHIGDAGDVPHGNFGRNVWEPRRTDLGSWTDSLMLCLFSFSGFEQPFYVITEVRSPRKRFPRYTIAAVLFAAVLFMMVNVAYLLIVDKSEIMIATSNANGWYLTPDLATIFFDKIFQGEHDRAVRAMAAVIAISIFGNLWVMTYTAARVKQEIAKEGILPWSLYYATSYRTPWGLFRAWRSNWTLPEPDVERAPTAAYTLHWFTSVLLITVVSPIADTRKSYSILVYLFTYAIILVLGCWVSLGLLIVKCQKKWHWQDRRRYRPWLSPVHAVVYFSATLFLAVAALVPPKHDSPFYKSLTGLLWFILPLIGISAPFWGLIWFALFRLYESKLWSSTQLEIVRTPHYKPDPLDKDEYLMHSERIGHWWPIREESRMGVAFAEGNARSGQHLDGTNGAIVLREFGRKERQQPISDCFDD